MNKTLKKVLLATLLMTVGFSAQAAKPIGLVETSATFTVLAEGSFTQEFEFTTSENYNTGTGLIFARGLDSMFKKPMSINLYGLNGTSISGDIAATTQAGSLVASFADKSFSEDLAGLTTYKMVVSGVAKSAGVSFNIGGAYIQSISPVPEPETYLMWLAGLGMIGAVALRRGGS